jgi:hypothetical protein
MGWREGGVGAPDTASSGVEGPAASGVGPDCTARCSACCRGLSGRGTGHWWVCCIDRDPRWALTDSPRTCRPLRWRAAAPEGLAKRALSDAGGPCTRGNGPYSMAGRREHGEKTTPGRCSSAYVSNEGWPKRPASRPNRVRGPPVVLRARGEEEEHPRHLHHDPAHAPCHTHVTCHAHVPCPTHLPCDKGMAPRTPHLLPALPVGRGRWRCRRQRRPRRPHATHRPALGPRMHRHRRPDDRSSSAPLSHIRHALESRGRHACGRTQGTLVSYPAARRHPSRALDTRHVPKSTALVAGGPHSQPSHTLHAPSRRTPLPCP